LDGNARGIDDPATPDTGIPFLGVTVDMGAYEFNRCPLPSDINCDGMVNFLDLVLFSRDWLGGV
jgi:hypothetical protein